MLNLLLDLRAFTIGLIVLAVATPLLALAHRRWRPGSVPGRTLVAFGAFGPVALTLWGLHNAVLATVGFDHVASVLIMLALGIVVGIAAGLWLRGGGSQESDGRR